MKSNEELNVIAALDLDPIKVKLMHKESGEGWSRSQVDVVEFEYRRFLCLMKLFPHEQVAPRFDVDIFWHYHILDTMKYAADCEHIFGYFLHHYPYSGLGGEDEEVDKADHRRTGARMQELYEATFGAPLGPVEGHTKTASSPHAPQQSAWSTGMSATMEQTAWSTGMSPVAETAWSNGMSPTAQTAWSTGMSPMAQTAWSTGMRSMAKTAWSTGASADRTSKTGALPIMNRPRLKAKNDSVFSPQALAMAA